MTNRTPMPADRWPATKIEMWQVSDLVPYARNARTHPPEQIDQIAASMGGSASRSRCWWPMMARSSRATAG